MMRGCVTVLRHTSCISRNCPDNTPKAKRYESKANPGRAGPQGGATYRPYHNQVVDSWVKFKGEGVPPDRIGGTTPPTDGC